MTCRSIWPRAPGVCSPPGWLRRRQRRPRDGTGPSTNTLAWRAPGRVKRPAQPNPRSSKEKAPPKRGFPTSQRRALTACLSGQNPAPQRRSARLSLGRHDPIVAAIVAALVAALVATAVVVTTLIVVGHLFLVAVLAGTFAIWSSLPPLPEPPSSPRSSPRSCPSLSSFRNRHNRRRDPCRRRGPCRPSRHDRHRDPCRRRGPCRPSRHDRHRDPCRRRGPCRHPSRHDRHRDLSAP